MHFYQIWTAEIIPVLIGRLLFQIRYKLLRVNFFLQDAWVFFQTLKTLGQIGRNKKILSIGIF